MSYTELQNDVECGSDDCSNRVLTYLFKAGPRFKQSVMSKKIDPKKYFCQETTCHDKWLHEQIKTTAYHWSKYDTSLTDVEVWLITERCIKLYGLDIPLMFWDDEAADFYDEHYHPAGEKVE
tara:strand:- start:34 stop:399 length:366 start_codon:yes stop_codon:yes gene_type:complete